MKKLFVRLAVVVLLVATVFGVAPHASAQDGTPSVLWADIYWDLECSSSLGLGVVGMTFAVTMYPGYSISFYEAAYGFGTSYSDSYSWVADVVDDFVWDDYWFVPYDGYWTAQYDVYAPNGVLVSSTMFRADCTTGEVWTSYGDVYGINEPAADKRVLGTVLVDTPVYSEASPTAALKPVLKAGQTWFIVGQTTGTDGALWYKVFVGGANLAWVPAAVMAPQGAVPGAK